MLSLESFEELLSHDFNEQFTVCRNDKYFEINIKKENVYLLIKYLNQLEKNNFNQLIDK